jgi:hypothetical protein
MITNLKIKNAYSIKELEMSFVKGKYGYKKDMTYKEIANPVALYGANGSGKSSVVNVLNDLLNLLIGDKESFYPFIANFLDKKEESLVEVTFKLDEDEYDYLLVTSFSETKIIKEVLSKNNKTVFSRNDEKIIIESNEYLVEEKLLLGLRQLYSIKDELTDTKESIKCAYNYLTNITIVKGDNTCNSKLCNYKNIEELMMINSNEVKRVLSNFKNFPLFDLYNEYEGLYLNVYTKNNKLKLPEFLVSDGMLTISKILTLLINMESESLLVIDCIEKNLHPSAILQLIKEAQKRNIQLLFTSHNTSLMQELRPDQIYFARWKDGYSYYFRLSNIYDNIREINNIEKMYLSNTFDEAINAIINIDK